MTTELLRQEEFLRGENESSLSFDSDMGCLLRDPKSLKVDCGGWTVYSLEVT